MRNKNLTLVIFFVLFMMDIALLWVNWSLKADKNSIEKENAGLSIKVDKLHKQVIQSVLSGTFEWAEDRQLYTSTDTIFIDSLLKGQKKLVLWFSQLSCRSCVDTQYQILLDKFDLIGEDNVLLISTSGSTRIISPFKRVNSISKEVYMTNLTLNKKEINMDTPCYFIMDENRKISDVFFPDRENEQLSNMYLDGIVSKYFSVSD